MFTRLPSTLTMIVMTIIAVSMDKSCLIVVMSMIPRRNIHQSKCKIVCYNLSIRIDGIYTVGSEGEEREVTGTVYFTKDH